jgi:hypothetical protein
MLRELTFSVCALAVAALLGSLGGCAETGANYPSVGTINDVSKPLSPQERDKTLNDLTVEKQKQAQAAK